MSLISNESNIKWGIIKGNSLFAFDDDDDDDDKEKSVKCQR